MFNANEFETIFSNCSNGTESYSLEYTLFADFRYKYMFQRLFTFETNSQRGNCALGL